MLPNRSNNVVGILAMLVAVATFGLMDAMFKVLAPHYPPIQVAALRGLASLPFVLAWIAWRREWRHVRRVRLPLHLMRGAISIAMLAAFTYALRTLPLADTYSIFFVAPLLITVLAGLVLRERIGWQRWLAIAIGFAGVVIVLRPTGDGVLSLAGLAVLASALGYAVSAITVRILARTDTTVAMVFWVTLVLSVGAGALAAPDWVPIASEHWLPIAAIGVAGTIGQVAVTLAFARGEASVIAPFEYTALAWGVFYDFAIWDAMPGAITLAGAAVLIASGLYLIRHERRRPSIDPDLP